VLVPGGTLAIGIWSSLDKQGIQQDYAEAVERVTGSASMHVSYGTVTEDSLRKLFSGAGFDDIAIDEVTIDLTFDAPDAFVGLMVESTSAGVPTMHGRSDDERAALADDVAREMDSAMQASTSEGRLRTHSTAYLAVGNRPRTQ
jgi:hypothetical protein